MFDVDGTIHVDDDAEVQLVGANYEDAAAMSSSHVKEAVCTLYFDIKDYNEAMAELDIRHVGYLEEFIREIMPEHTENIKNEIRETGYQISSGNMSTKAKKVEIVNAYFRN